MQVDNVKTRQYYEKEYHFDQDASSPPDLRRAERILKYLGKGGDRLIDLGGGVGWMSMLAVKGGRVRESVNLDISMRALRFGQELQADGVSFVCANGEALPLQTGSADRLLSFGSLEHFDDIDAGLKEIRRVLVPNGTAILVVPNFYVRTEQPQEFRTHYWGWKRIMERNGFEVLTTGKDWGPQVFRNSSARRVLLRIAGRVASLLPYLQYQLIMVLKSKPC